MSQITLHLIAAARPNFMKIAPLYHALRNNAAWSIPKLIHTGQHYDYNMSDSFFEDLELPQPDYHLGVGSGSHAEQTAAVMVAYEKLCQTDRPDLLIVVGDVNSTLACTLAAVKLGIRVAHLEAGLRSFDRTMPEEINRIVTDSLADLLWTPSPDGDENLLREGVSPRKIVRVGNIMLDSLEMLRKKIEAERVVDELHLEPHGYGIATLHRPATVDNRDALRAATRALIHATELLPIVVPLHPRTRKNLTQFGLMEAITSTPRLRIADPLPYRRFMNLLFSCRYVLTDSGGIQEETTYLGIPCLTLRENTERPVTITHGTNRLTNLQRVAGDVESLLKAPPRRTCSIDLWDGKCAGRVVDSIQAFCDMQRKAA